MNKKAEKVTKNTKNITKKSNKITKNNEEVTDKKYSVTSILLSKKYTNIEKDILKAILSKNEKYSHQEVRTLLNNFYERK